MYSYYNLIPKETHKIAYNEVCYTETTKPTNITSHIYVRRCYVCGQLGHKAYECETFTGTTMETYKNGEYIKQPWFSSMPDNVFKTLEKSLGWHMLIDAKLC